MTALPPKKKLVKSTALAKTQSTLVRLNNLIPTTTTVLSPTTVYQPGASSVGNELSGPTKALPNIAGWFGSWTAPDLNNGSPYQVQVECFGPGGGGGGGINNAGGGGGGGGEYACEPTYTVSPGVTYTYQIGLPGTGGCNNSSALLAQEGTAGSQTIFDLAGLGVPGGVVANPGQPGDAGSTGIGGQGGTGSTNSVVFAGGTGGTNNSTSGSDTPLTFAQTSGMFHNNTKNANIIRAWYIFNDGPDSTYEFNDSSTYHAAATVTTSSTGIQIQKFNAPGQVPAYNSAASPPHFPNPQGAGMTSLWSGANNGQFAGYVESQTFSFNGTEVTISAWLQCDPTGTWGQNAAYSVGTVAANSANYATFGNFSGYGLFFYNTGSSGSPNWYLYFNVGNGNNVANYVRTPMAPVVGTWYYVVVTFNSGAMTMYVNGVSVSTASAGFSSLPGGAYNTRLGTNPSGSGTFNYFFGYISNIWFALDAATSSLPAQAYGSTSSTAGAGGGASGSAGGAGNSGSAGSGSTGGAGGAPVALPAQYAAIRTAGSTGGSGGNAGASAPGTLALGAGGGGSGDMGSSPASFSLQIPFATAATYCGTDSSSSGALYNASQQTGNSVIITGGTSTDTASGSKNTLVLLPKGIASSLGNGKWTIQQITLTLTNSLLSSVNTVLEFAYTADTSLPQNYTGASIVEYVGAIPIDAGQNTVTYDLTQSNLGTLIQNGTCTALCFGPANDPTFDAFNASTGAQFYCQVYGPGAVDNFGNSLAPYLTVVFQETLTTQTGDDGGSGAIRVTSLTTGTAPVTMVQPFAGTDAGGNQFASGITTTAITAYKPTSLTPGSYTPETWTKVTTFASGVAASGNGTNGFYYRMNPDGFVEALYDLTFTSIAAGTSIIAAGIIPSAYWPNGSSGNVNAGTCCAYGTGVPAGTGGSSPYLGVANTGAIVYRFNGASSASFSIAGYIRWWPGTV